MTSIYLETVFCVLLPPVRITVSVSGSGMEQAHLSNHCLLYRYHTGLASPCEVLHPEDQLPLPPPHPLGGVGCRPGAAQQQAAPGLAPADVPAPPLLHHTLLRHPGPDLGAELGTAATQWILIYLSINPYTFICISIPVSGVGVDAPAEQQAGVGGVEGVVPPVLGQPGQLARGVGGGAEHLHRAPRTPATRHHDGCSRIGIFGETMIPHHRHLMWSRAAGAGVRVFQRSSFSPNCYCLRNVGLFFCAQVLSCLLLTSRGYVNEDSS